MMVIVPAKMPAFSRLCLERNVSFILVWLLPCLFVIVFSFPLIAFDFWLIFLNEFRINFPPIATVHPQVAVVMASYPATDLLLSRARFCVSAGHSKEDLEKAIDVITEIGNLCLLNYNKNGTYIKLS